MKKVSGNNCPELELFLDKFDTAVPVPPGFVTHAGGCKSCLYWLSSILAAAESLSMVERKKLSNCPEQSVFREMLFVIIRSYAKLNAIKGDREEVGAETRKNLLVETAAEVARHAPVFEHMCGCEHCRTYYDELYSYMAREQKTYAGSILEGKELIPIVVDGSRSPSSSN